MNLAFHDDEYISNKLPKVATSHDAKGEVEKMVKTREMVMEWCVEARVRIVIVPWPNHLPYLILGQTWAELSRTKRK